MIATIGKVIEQPGSLTIQTARPDAENLSDTVTVLWQDCRTISPEQRRKAWALIGDAKTPPTRVMRYCCSWLKETNGDGRMTITGVRWAESARRKENQGVAVISGKPKTTQKKADALGVDYSVSKSGALVMNEDNDENRRLAEFCYRTQKMLLNPIVDWTDEDVWDFLDNIVKVPHCCLYDEGFKRIGCIGCPLAGGRNNDRNLRDSRNSARCTSAHLTA